MNVKKSLRNFPGVVRGFRLAMRIAAIVRRICANTLVANNIENIQSALVFSDRRHRFVGYYDHSPFKEDDEKLLLVHSTNYPSWRRPSSNSPVFIELINHQDGTVVRKLGESYAWNWQQGARALWLNSETVIFNIYDSATDQYKARMVNCDGTHLGDLPIPVQEIDRKGRVYSLSYEALAAIRPDYGYRNRKPSSQNFKGNMIEQFDPVTQQHNVLLRLSTLQQQIQDRHGSTITKAKFNHVMASPDATRLVFLLRYFLNGRRITDLYMMPTCGGPSRLLVSDSGVSHVCWWGGYNVIATMMGANGFGYYLVPIDGAVPTLLWAKEDGHPGRICERHLLTDTYPNQYALRQLLIRDLDSDELIKLGTFREPLLYQGETRCDLHPCASLSKRYIQVDCAVGHQRTVAVLENPLFKEERL